MTNLLENPGFEGSWWRKTHTGQEFGELFVPLRWVAYWREGGPVPHDPHNQSGYGRPEMHVINREAPFLDPIRVRSGERALKFFTFYRIHDAGVYQQVTGVEPGTCLRGTGWGHAWSSTKDDPRTSEGVGRQAFSIRSSDYQAGAMDEAVRNVTLALGIDPTGGNDPWSERVVWGEGAHIYNAYAQIPSVEVEAEADRVTFFVRSTVLWPFKHCDVYLDDMRLTALREERASVDIALSPERIRAGEPFEVTVSGGRGPTGLTVAIEDSRVYQQSPYIAGESLKGRYVATEPGTYEVQVWAAQTPVAAQTPWAAQTPMASRTFRVEAAPTSSRDCVPPREPYERTYLLMPPDADRAWLAAVARSGVWDRFRWTIGASADDAGIGPPVRRVIAVNPDGWGDDLEAFFEAHYPGVQYGELNAATPEALEEILETLVNRPLSARRRGRHP